ncbi:MAG: DsbA family oxidoreductase [Solirubrobacteraceae bacterium]|jgi:predicted DsbA family dithiol-disulfide isomerase
MDVEIWSDIACPWCYIGKRRFEKALAEFEHADEVRVIWRSFELDPAAPHERTGDRAEHLAAKYGLPVERAREMEQHVTDLAAGEGLGYRFDIARASTTFDGHRLVHLAGMHGLQDAMKERLLSAYFTEGRLISDHDTLVELAREVGIDPDEVREMLGSDRFAQDVRTDEQAAAQLGISGVPTFVIERRLGVSGAQPPEALHELLREGWEQLTAVD